VTSFVGLNSYNNFPKKKTYKNKENTEMKAMRLQRSDPFIEERGEGGWGEDLNGEIPSVLSHETFSQTGGRKDNADKKLRALPQTSLWTALVEDRKISSNLKEKEGGGQPGSTDHLGEGEGAAPKEIRQDKRVVRLHRNQTWQTNGNILRWKGEGGKTRARNMNIHSRRGGKIDEGGCQ